MENERYNLVIPHYTQQIFACPLSSHHAPTIWLFATRTLHPRLVFLFCLPQLCARFMFAGECGSSGQFCACVLRLLPFVSMDISLRFVEKRIRHPGGKAARRRHAGTGLSIFLQPTVHFTNRGYRYPPPPALDHSPHACIHN